MHHDVLTRLLGFLRGSWLRQGVWSVLDQSLFAGANFVVNVLLARWLAPEAYGAFTVAFVVFLLAGTVHGGLLIEPMLVFGPDRFKTRTAAYLRVLLGAHASYSAVAGAVLAVIAAVMWAVGSPLLAGLFLTLAVAQGAILALWLMRRACYLVSRPDWAVAAGALYLLLLVGGAVALDHVQLLSGAVALALMGATSLVSAGALALRLGIPLRAPERALAADARLAHTEYGRWAAPTGFVEWLQTAIPYLGLPIFVGLAGSGALRAFYNLAMPAFMGFAALATLALPTFVRARASGTFSRTARSVGGAFVGLGLVYGVLILLFGRAAVDWLYAGQYTVTTAILAMLAVGPVGVAFANVLVTVVRSAEQPRLVFHARTASVGMTSTLGLAVTALFGVTGALLSDVLGMLTEIAMLLNPARRALAESETAPDGDQPDAPINGQDATPDRLRVLLCSFACGPGGGSEPGIGWNTARELARHHEVTVLTYSGARLAIEAELAVRPLKNVTFVYYSVPFEPERFRVHGEPMADPQGQLHYLFWQWGATRVAHRLHRAQPFDLAQHLTFVKYWAPSAVAGLGIPFVWGPVGGGEATPPAFLDVMSREGARYERSRLHAQRLFEWLPSVRRTARASTLAFATTEETRERMEALGARHVEVRSAIGLPADEIGRLARLPLPDDGPARFVCIGRQLAWKGYRFAIEAFAVAAEDAAFDGAELWFIGEGPENDRLRALAVARGVADRVRFLGQLTRDEVLECIAAAHVLVQPSLHDSGGSVCLEALAAGRPVVGFALGGTVIHAPPEASRLVAAEAPETAVPALAAAMAGLATDPKARRRLGRAGRRIIAEQFNWSIRVADLADRYWDVVGRPRPTPPEAVPVLELAPPWT